MKRLALKIEHRYKNKLVGAHLLEAQGPSSGPVSVLGSSRNAHLKLLGDGVSGIHAAFEKQGEHWVISDLGSESGTWINKKPIVEHPITGATVIHIGGHQIKATPQVLDRQLFVNTTSSVDQQGEVFHQFIVMKDGHLVRSDLVDSKSSCLYSIKGTDHSFLAPTAFDWTETKVDNYVVKQRLVKAHMVEEDFKERVRTSMEPRVHGPMISAVIVFLLIFGVMFLMPNSKDDAMTQVLPQAQNQFTRMIYDANKIKAKKAEAEKLRKNIAGQSKQGVKKDSKGGSQQAGGGPAKDARPGTKVVSNIRAAGLGKLIGKISKRAASNTVLLEAAGVSADNPNSGRAFSLGGGSSLDKVGPRAGEGGGSQKIAGLGTGGKGGGSAAYKGSGALSLGNVGNAEVGVIEEETEVDGGLDRDAISRVIKSQLGQIRYCYERQLSANPELYGKVLVKFTIGAAGAVTAQMIGNTSLNNAMVEGCILRRVAGWQFPQPKGGTNVIVTYPFLFKSTK